MNRKFLTTVLFVAFLFACSSKETNDTEIGSKLESKDSLLETTAKEEIDSNAEVTEITEIDFRDKKNLPKPVSLSDKISYLQGFDLGQGMKDEGIKPNPDFFALGILHGYDKDESYMPNDEKMKMQQEVHKYISERRKKRIEAQEKEFMASAGKHLEEGKKFLEDNKTKEGIIVTQSGLQYKVLKEGSGNNPKPNDMVLLHLKGHFIDGTEFDDTFKRNEPVPVMINDQLIPAWREALLMMKPGSRYKLFTPANLAFGDKGIFPSIPPNAVIIFEILLVENRGNQPIQQQMQAPPQFEN